MADGTVIVQHLASVDIFCCAFVAIIQGRVSPVTVVSWASLCTVLGWILWDYWVGQEQQYYLDNPDIPLSSSSSPSPSLSPSGIKPVDDAPGIQSSFSERAQQRIATAKSALLIYAALLGLSPILKSLTRSTTSDSIWAISTWLLMMNIAFFDYSSGPSAQ